MPIIMQFTNSLQVALWFACQAGASPVSKSVALTPNATIEMLKRVSTVPVLCDLVLEPSPRLINPRSEVLKSLTQLSKISALGRLGPFKTHSTC